MSVMLRFEELPEVNSERWLSLEDLEGEVWKRMNECGGNYSISNYGRVKSHSRLRSTGHGGKTPVKERIMRLTLLKTKGGYWYASFHTKSGTSSDKLFVHRLVAQYFVNNPNEEKCVNHKDENSRNNIFYNLEWCSYAYNNSYGTAHARAQATRIKKGICKTVGKFDSDGRLVTIFPSLVKTAKEANADIGIMSYYCNKEKKFKDGFLYKYI